MQLSRCAEDTVPVTVPATLSQRQAAPSLTTGSGAGQPGHSPQAPHQPGELEKAGVRGEAELAARQGQLAVLEGVVGDGDAQGPAGRGRPSAPASGSRRCGNPGRGDAGRAPTPCSGPRGTRAALEKVAF